MAVALLFAAAVAGAAVSYEVRIEGLPDGALLNALRNVSHSVSLRDRPPSTLMLLRRRAERDVPRFVEVLQAEGYYGARVELDIDEDRDPVRVTFSIDAGPPYTLAEARIEVLDPSDDVPAPTAADLGLHPDAVVRAATLLAAQRALTERFRENGFPYPQASPPRVEISHEARRATVVFTIAPGARGLFGPTSIAGLDSVDEDFVRGRLPWTEGEPFSVRAIRDARRRLNASGLFSVVDISIAEEAGADGAVPVSIQVTERKHRTIRAGLNYTTDEGVGARAAWEHRNFRGGGQRLALDATLSEIASGFDAAYTIPDFERRDQTLTLRTALRNERPDAYDSLSLGGGAMIERVVSERSTLGLGVYVRGAEIEQRRRTSRFALLSFPMFYAWTTADDLLAPTEGGRLRVDLTPIQDLRDLDLQLLRGAVSYAHYVRLSRSPSVVLATRIGTGTVFGARYGRIPADERFYVGGGGSVRGYAYQSLGPLDDKTPLGGRSYIESAFELRMSVTETIGVAAFLDGGSAFEAEYPDFSESLRWAAGLGLRYYSPVGPIRLDVAIPLNRRRGVDDAFQVYAGLGHAF